jgi:Flp pilus assembly protein TadD
MFSNASRINPGLAQARWNLGNSYLVKGDVAKALAEMKAGVDLSPNDVEAHSRYGNTLIQAGKLAEGAPYFEMVVRAQPNDAHAHFTLGTVYLAQKRSEKAIVEFKEAIRLSPETPQCLNALAWIYATSPKAELRNGTEAVRLAEKACALTRRQSAEVLDTLAAAYAETARFEDAIKAATEARTVALAGKDAAAAAVLAQRLQFYQSGNPYREEP